LGTTEQVLRDNDYSNFMPIVCLHGMDIFTFCDLEILGALFSVLVIWILTGVLIYLAIDRIIHQDYDIDANTMIIVSSIGVVMNIAMGAILHGGQKLRQDCLVIFLKVHFNSRSLQETQSGSSWPLSWNWRWRTRPLSFKRRAWAQS
jgi:hypothetical protein